MYNNNKHSPPKLEEYSSVLKSINIQHPHLSPSRCTVYHVFVAVAGIFKPRYKTRAKPKMR